MKLAWRLLAVIFILAMLGFLAVMFVFGFQAALIPGPQHDPQSDAAGVAALGVVVTIFGAVGSLFMSGDLS